MVVYGPNLHPGTRAPSGFGYTTPRAIGLKNIVFEIHRVSRGSYISLKSIDFGSAGGKHLDRVRRIELRPRSERPRLSCAIDSGDRSQSAGLALGLFSLRRSLRRLRRDIIRLFFILRPKNKYSTSPTTGRSNRTVTHARDFTGLRFSERITTTITMVEPRATAAKAV